MNALELRDIHLPSESLWWPLAPGWWVLAFLGLALIVMLPRIMRWLRRKPLRRTSLQQLKQIRKDHHLEADSRILLARLSELLRRTLISYQGRKGFAGSTGDEWIGQIEALSASQPFSQEQLELLTSGRYRADLAYDPDALLASCEKWLRSLPGAPDVPD
ncbi:MAG: DUF4381 domain-containing protein [Pseudomonadota bacterium]